MNIKAIQLFWFFSIIVSACNEKPMHKVDFSLDSFTRTDSILNGEVYKNEKLFLGNPRWLKFHPDSFLIVSDLNNTSRFIKIIDLKTNEVQEMIPSGKGPGEMITAWGIGIINMKIWVFDGQLRKICILKMNESRKFSIESEFSLKEKTTMGISVVNDSLIACLSGLEDKVNRLAFCDFKGNIIRKTGTFPKLNSASELESDNNIFQSAISSFPNSSKVVLACNAIDIFEIYDTHTGIVSRFHGPLGIDLTARKINVGIGYKMDLEPNCSTFTNISCSDTSIWISYSGNCFTKRDLRTYSNVFPKNILCFSENGIPKQVLNFRNNILYFDVDWKNKNIYCLEWDDKIASIVRYEL